MGSGGTTLTLGGVIGLLLCLFGAAILITGRAPERTMRLFARERDAGMYHLLFGVALVVLALGQSFFRGPVAVVTGFAALATAAVGLIKFRPRSRKGHTSRT